VTLLGVPWIVAPVEVALVGVVVKKGRGWGSKLD